MESPRIGVDLVAADGTAEPVPSGCRYLAAALWAAHVSPSIPAGWCRTGSRCTSRPASWSWPGRNWNNSRCLLSRMGGHRSGRIPARVLGRSGLALSAVARRGHAGQESDVLRPRRGRGPVRVTRRMPVLVGADARRGERRDDHGLALDRLVAATADQRPVRPAHRPPPRGTWQAQLQRFTSAWSP